MQSLFVIWRSKFETTYFSPFVIYLPKGINFIDYGFGVSKPWINTKYF